MKKITLTLFIVLFSIISFSQTKKIEEFYQLRAGNSWNYVAPSTWKGDYVSLMKVGGEFQFEDKNYSTILHFDATKAAKILGFIKGKGIVYFGEDFADKTFIRFDKPQIWFPEKVKIGTETNIETSFTRTLTDGKTNRGIYKLKQKYVSIADVKVTAGEFKKCLRIESESFWELGDGRQAKTISVYHYAKNVGVIKASARFIILQNGKETINRVIETELKFANVAGKMY